LKGGLYSKDEKVVLSCLEMFQALITELNLGFGEIVGQTWDWFVNPSEVTADSSSFAVRATNQAVGSRGVSQFKQPS